MVKPPFRTVSMDWREWTQIIILVASLTAICGVFVVGVITTLKWIF